VRSVGHQTSCFDEFREIGHRRQPQDKPQGDDTYAIGVYERIATDVKCVRAPFKRVEHWRDVRRSLNFECGYLVSKLARSRLDLPNFQNGNGIPSIGHDRQPMEAGNNLAQEFEPLVSKIDLLKRQSGDVAARPSQTRDEVTANWVARYSKNNR